MSMDTALAALSSEEIQQFITNGFLVKRNILDPRTLRRRTGPAVAGKHLKSFAPDDPKTWINGIPEADRPKHA